MRNRSGDKSAENAACRALPSPTPGRKRQPGFPDPATCSNGRLRITCGIVKTDSERGAIRDMPAKPRKTALPGRLIGYARVSTEEQGTDPQLDELRAAGCETVLEEHASGADRTRPVLARLLREIRPGETLVVVRLDRLARRSVICWLLLSSLRPRARISAAFMTQSICHAAGHVLACRCWEPSRSSKGRSSPSGPKPG